MSDFGKKIGRFNAEYGFQSFPEYSTLQTFSEKKDWDLESEVMKHHQKSYVGNGMILKHARLLFGEPVNFEEFVYLSQLTQAKAVRLAVTGHRLDAPRCMGTLYWQVNDCWPAPSWSSIDYFGNWKAIQYCIKEDYEDVAVLSKLSTAGTEEFYLVSDQPDTFLLNLNYTIYNLRGKELMKGEVHKRILGNVSDRIFLSGKFKKFDNQNFLVQFSWNDAKGTVHHRTFSHLPRPYSKGNISDIKLELTEVDPLKKTAKIILSTTKYIRNAWIYSSVSGVHLEENFIDLMPGKHIFKMEFKKIPNIDELGVRWL
jgi:beta-mannosidase